MNRETDVLAGAELARLRGSRAQLGIELESGVGQGVLTKIEHGKRHPEKSTLLRILDALDAKYSERKRILELYGYMAPPLPPSENDIDWAINMCRSKLEDFPFPAYLLDCTHTLRTFNSRVRHLIDKTSEEAKKYIGVSMVDLIYDARDGLGILVDNPDDFHRSFVLVLRREMGPYNDAPWYKEMMNEYANKHHLFARYWNAPFDENQEMSSRQLAQLHLATKKFDILKFYLFSETFIRDTRFRIVHYLPSDVRTMEIVHRW